MANSQKPIIVIIPGAYHTPFQYRKISDSLRAGGYEVISSSHIVCSDDVDPEKTFFDDAAAYRKKLIPFLDQGKNAVIVSHSYGSLPAVHTVQGQTVAERAERGLIGGIVGVVNIAGFVFPARGKGIKGDDQIDPPPPFQLVKDGIAHLQDGAKPLFFGGLTPEEIEFEWAHLEKKQTRKSFTVFPQYVESEIQCPKTYILCEQDEAVPPAFQEQMARLGGYDIVRLDSAHAPFLTIPQEVVAIIEKVADSSSSSSSGNGN
ncbi:hypothetical protein FE257_004805 [Aspergillus nanangensis]|uniref:AB hydrolase-1 domain-containing protein n=1 Tax=Aspergillus nanangensis TaxID=2582783 RepID=A0AAD4CR79_ASPNN|nr:hypothetical protein FE257_004805 [Aspergillus nanangensis]